MPSFSESNFPGSEKLQTQTSSDSTPQRLHRQAVRGLVLAILLPPLGLLLSIIAIVSIRRHSASEGKILALSGAIIGCVLTGALAYSIATTGGILANKAQHAFKPIDKQLQATGALKICDNGDSGHGIDNSLPWHTTYYTMPNTANLTETVKDISSQAGYDLHINTVKVARLKGEYSAIIEVNNGPPYSSADDYLTATKGKNTLDVSINRNAEVPLYCSEVDSYGQPETADVKTAVLTFHMQTH